MFCVYNSFDNAGRERSKEYAKFGDFWELHNMDNNKTFTVPSKYIFKSMLSNYLKSRAFSTVLASLKYLFLN